MFSGIWIHFHVHSKVKIEILANRANLVSFLTRSHLNFNKLNIYVRNGFAWSLCVLISWTEICITISKQWTRARCWNMKSCDIRSRMCRADAWLRKRTSDQLNHGKSLQNYLQSCFKAFMHFMRCENIGFSFSSVKFFSFHTLKLHIDNKGEIIEWVSRWKRK